MVIFGAVFIFSMRAALRTMLEYRAIDALYEESAAEYTTVTAKDSLPGENAEEEEKSAVPITVDFTRLQEINEDVVGWIYCEGTNINYPVVQGEDNNFYLDHNYRRETSRAGSIFVEANNTIDFGDSNTIIHGHHMKNGAMFATLSNWADQTYYEEHPEMWLLTPEQNYQIILFSGYLTKAVSNAYRIFRSDCPEFEEYLREARENSDFSADVDIDSGEKFVVLSTCEYNFENARYVLHGMLVPFEE